MENLKKIVNFFFEVISLKQVKRSGLPVAGARNPDSVAEHCFAAAQIAYILAKMEKANAEHSTILALFHDNGESRVGDLHLIQKCYLNSEQGERRALFDQTAGIPADEDLKEMFEEFKKGNTPESVIARDADRLELALQAKYSIDVGGNKAIYLWFDRIRVLLRTESAKKLLEVIEKTDMNEWWQSISEIQEKIEKWRSEKSNL